ncbi:ATP-binding cassette domain-containing protein [Marmoricola sp. RAF53]|uniref:ATP-binding cassette domain-containing protein n=1 Tax=Marmoricola sp. RAF53 TaxID=3233059 RepID=UPI003F948E90
MIARARRCLALMVQTVGPARIGVLLALQFVVAVLEAAGLVLIVPVIQALGGEDSLSLPGFDLHLSLPEAFALVVAVVLLRALGQWASAVLATDVRLATVDRLRLGLLDDLYAAEWSYLSGQRRSHVVQQLTTDVERAHSAFAMVFRLIVGTLILLATGAVAVLLAPVIGLIAVGGVVVVAALASRSTRSAAALGRTMTDRLAGFGAALTDSLASVRVMRAHDAAGAWSTLVGTEAARVRETRRAFVARGTAISSTLGVAAVFAVLAMILLGREAGLSLAELATLAVVATRLLGSAQTLLGSAQAFANDSPAVQRLEEFHAEVLAHPERVPESAVPAAVVVEGAGKRRAPVLLSLRGIGVSYDEDGAPGSEVLRDVDLDVPARGLVTITGASGSGKSTLLDVVLGLRAPQAGQVLVDGLPRTDLAAWRARLGYVPQQTVLVPGTVFENLAWSLQPGRTLTEGDAWDALRAASVDDVVRALPGGLHARLQEIAELSGGEQQRLSIARALVRRPELLVLDEATSALDRTTEARVLDTLLDGTRAVLMVTHRSLDGRESAVLHLDDGRAAEVSLVDG